MADKWNREDEEPMTGAGEERLRGIADDDDDEFDDVDADDLDEEEDEEEGQTF